MGKLDPSDRPRRISKDFEAQHRPSACLNRSMVLLNDVVQIPAGSNLDPVPPLGLTPQLEECAVAGIVPIERHSHRGASGRECFPEGRLRCLDIAVLTQPEIDGPATLVHSALKVTPLPSDANVGLVDTPGLPDGTGKAHPALFEFWHEALYPAEHRSVSKLNP